MEASAPRWDVRWQEMLQIRFLLPETSFDQHDIGAEDLLVTAGLSASFEQLP